MHPPSGVLGPGQLGVQVRTDAEGRTIRLSGHLVLISAPELETLVTELAASAEDIVLDLSELAFMDSSGMRAILVCRELCEHNGARFALSGVAAQPRRVFEISGLLSELPLVG
jgi:anti-sigma B factor antagonist